MRARAASPEACARRYWPAPIGALGALIGPFVTMMAAVPVGASAFAVGWPARRLERSLAPAFALFATFLLGALAIAHARLAAAPLLAPAPEWQ